MPWDWDELKKKQRGTGGGPPPQMDQVFTTFKGLRAKLPGLWIIVLIVVIIAVVSSSFYTVGVNEVGVVFTSSVETSVVAHSRRSRASGSVEAATARPVRPVRTSPSIRAICSSRSCRRRAPVSMRWRPSR